MSSETVIWVENVSKQYVIGHEVQHDTLRDKLTSCLNPAAWRRRKRAKTEDFWALRDISFDVKRGEVVGIVGRNGAGKSTLLKILSRITEPSAGKITLRGRVASLLEVGTGFHPELTGRENIYLNGAILGMKRTEIIRKFDEIVAFAEIEKFIDTPVKHYSSGMYVRLAFAVAAHLEPDILIIDEVLAVGDAAFQKKCLGKMQDVSKGEGRTVLFVSHNESAVRRLCTHGILLESGKLAVAGTPNEIFQVYKAGKQSSGFSDQRRIHKSDRVRIESAALMHDGIVGSDFLSGDQPQLEVVVSVARATTFSLEIILRDANSTPVMFAPLGLARGIQNRFDPGVYELCLELRLPLLAEGAYSLDLIIAEPGVQTFDYLEEALVFTMQPQNNQITGWIFRQSRGQGCALLDTSPMEIRPAVK